jgi:enoyl-CoA hydratase
MGGSARLTRLVGPRYAKKILMLGEPMSAEEAERIGLIEFVVPEDTLSEFSLSLAKKLAAKPAWAMKFIKKAVNVSAEGGLQAGLLFEQVQSAFCCGLNDKDEAIKAFFEKRDPSFD